MKKKEVRNNFEEFIGKPVKILTRLGFTYHTESLGLDGDFFTFTDNRGAQVSIRIEEIAQVTSWAGGSL